MSTHMTQKEIAEKAVDYAYSLGLDTNEIVQVLWHDHPVSPLDVIKKAMDDVVASRENSNATE